MSDIRTGAMGTYLLLWKASMASSYRSSVSSVMTISETVTKWTYILVVEAGQ